MMLRKYIVEWRSVYNRWFYYDRYFTFYGAVKAAAKLASKEDHVNNWKVSKMNSNGVKETRMVIHRRAAS